MSSSPSPNPSSVNRRNVLANNLSKEAQRAIAFLDAEERMIELRLSRRTRGGVEETQTARHEFEQRRDQVIQSYTKADAPQQGHRRLNGPGARRF